MKILTNMYKDYASVKEYLSCQLISKALQLLCVIAHTNWGADKNTLLKLYRSLIRSKIDYSCFIYQSCKKILLKIIKPYSSHQTKTGTRCFQNNSSRKPEANETPPKLRCNNLVLKYDAKLKPTSTILHTTAPFIPNIKIFSNKTKILLKLSDSESNLSTRKQPYQ